MQANEIATNEEESDDKLDPGYRYNVMKNNNNNNTDNATPIRYRTYTKRKSGTTLLCELTRLKSQQKYLESNQTKLLIDHFIDNDANATTNNSHTTTVSKLINEIELLRTALETDVQKYHLLSRETVTDIHEVLQQLKEDASQPERLCQYSTQVLRGRIIALHAQLEGLSQQNVRELSRLQMEYKALEKETKILIT